MTQTIKKILPIVAIVLATVACERIPFDPQIDTLNENLPVVYGVIGDHPDYRSIEISRTAPYMDGTEMEKIEDAEVSVSGPEETYAFKHTEKGRYVAPERFQPDVNTTYYLTIELDGETYKAESTMRQHVNMHSLKVNPDRWEDPDDGIYEITGWVKDNEPEDERFLFKYAVNGQLRDSVNVWSHYTDQLTNNQWLEDALLFGNIEAEKGDSIDVFVLSISTGYYDFIQAAEKNRISHNPFTPPGGVPITGNINNGALGIFQVSGIVHERVFVPKQED